MVGALDTMVGALDTIVEALDTIVGALDTIGGALNTIVGALGAIGGALDTIVEQRTGCYRRSNICISHICIHSIESCKFVGALDIIVEELGAIG